MENQVNMGDQNTQQIGQNPVNQPVLTQERPKVNYLMIGGIVLACFVIFGFGGYYLGKQTFVSRKDSVEQQVIPTPSPISPVTNSPTAIPSRDIDLTKNWETYNNALLGIQFKYPSFLKLSEGDSPIVGTGTGNSYYINLKTDTSSYPDVSMGGISKNFSEGRGGMFTDTQGYSERNGNYYCIGIDTEELISKNRVKKTSNSNGVEMLIVSSGVNEPNPAGESNCTEPDFGNIGILINLQNNKRYTGLGILYRKSSSSLTNDVFDQILSTLKFVN